MTATVDAAYVAYLTRENAWLRARVQELVLEVEGLRAALEEARLAATVLEARLEEREREEAS